MNECIFREYDIRGIVEQDFNTDMVVNLGKAFGTYLKNQEQSCMSISGDVRHTTDKLKKDFISGVISTGIDVYDMGVLPTPVNYFSLFNTNIPNSVQVTGSHNPSNYNGFKMSVNRLPFYGDSIQNLKKIILDGTFIISDKLGQINKVEIIDEYMNYIINDIDIVRPLKVAMDCGNAVAGIIAPRLFKSFKIDLEEIYCDINPDFPNHHPDPTVDHNLVDLSKCVIENKCDLGIAYDGDADRVVAIDEKGSIVRSDVLISLFVNDIILENDPVVYDVKCSRSLEDVIKSVKGIPVLSKTGHSHIKNKMYETKSKVGGEMSGHIFFSHRFFGFDDGIYVSLRLIELIAKSDKKLSELVSVIPKYYSTPEIRIDCKDDIVKKDITNRAIDYFVNKFECDQTDGVKVFFKSGWGLIRSSNTQPVIVCRFEADNKHNLSKIKNKIFDKLKEFGISDV